MSPWRAYLILFRAESEIPALLRRWKRAPGTLPEVLTLLGRLERGGSILPLPGLPGFFRAASPYALQRALDEREVLFELHPRAALSHLSAMVFHGLTDLFPKAFHLTVADPDRSEWLPLGTTGEDAQLLTGILHPQTPSRVLGQEVLWHRLKSERVFGALEFTPAGFPIRVTRRERTLLDGLAHPEWCGGFANVLQAWRRAVEGLNVDLLCDYAERLGIGTLKQRTGYILESLGINSPRLDQWAEGAHRGSSSRLVAENEFSSVFSERWKLSLNAPLEPLLGDET